MLEPVTIFLALTGSLVLGGCAFIVARLFGRHGSGAMVLLLGALAVLPLVVLVVQSPVGEVAVESAPTASSSKPSSVTMSGTAHLHGASELEQRRLGDISLPDWSAGLLAKFGWVWLLGAGVALIVLGVRLVNLRRLKRSLVSAPRSMQRELEVLADELEMESVPQLFLSNTVGTPFCAWWGRALIVLPTAEMEADTRRMVILHELAHLRQRDLQLLILQGLSRVVQWWNPFAHAVGRRLSEERELLCDRVVAERACPRDYASFLVSLSEKSDTPRAPLCAMASSYTAMKRRVQEIMNTQTDHRMILRRCARAATTAFVIAASVAWLFVIEPVFAKPAEAPEVEPEEKSVGTQRHIADGVAHTKAREFGKARDAFERALKLDPDHFPTRFNLAEVIFADQQYALAQRKFEDLLVDFPAMKLESECLIRFKLVVAHLGQGKRAEALKLLGRLLTEAKARGWRTTAGGFGIAAVALHDGDREKAIKMIDLSRRVRDGQFHVYMDTLTEQGWIDAEGKIK